MQTLLLKLFLLFKTSLNSPDLDFSCGGGKKRVQFVRINETFTSEKTRYLTRHLKIHKNMSD